MKRPAYQWYPGDWRRDTALQACSWEARAFWRDLLDVMHDGQPYGHLAINGHPIPLARVAAMIGLSVARAKKYLAELEAAGVSSRTASGLLYSRRMVKDEHIRTVRAESGRQGGNPSLVGSTLLKQTAKQNGNQMPTPAVAVASASPRTTPSVSHPREPSASELKLTGRLADPTDREAIAGFLDRSPPSERMAWASSLNALLDGLHLPAGLQPTPAQLAATCRDYRGDFKSPAHFRGFLMRELRGPPVREAVPAPSNGQIPVRLRRL